MKQIILLLAVLSLLFIIGCDQRFDTQVLPNPNEKVSVKDTSFVEVFPPYGGFQTPVAILVGNDQLIYIADYDSNQVVMMDAGGVILMKRHIPHPRALAQNYKLDLYVCGETIAPNNRDTIGALYRIYLARFDTTINGQDTSFFYNHDLENAPMRIVRKEPERPRRRYVGIGVLPGNGYLLARTGPDNTSYVDPDNRVLQFTKNDVFTSPVPDLITRASGGTAITDINKLTGFIVIPSSSDFIALQSNEGTAYGVIWMYYQNTASNTGWVPKFNPSNPDQSSIDFIKPYRYSYPTGVTYDKKKRDIYIVDAAQDSVFKFDRNGKFKIESFGFNTSQSGQLPGFKHPQGIAYSDDCTLYIADTGNHLIRRFKLSIQTTCY